MATGGAVARLRSGPYGCAERLGGRPKVARVARRYTLSLMADELTESLYLRISPGDRALLDELSKRLPLKAATIARAALRIGLAEVQRRPGRILETEAPKKRGKR